MKYSFQLKALLCALATSAFFSVYAFSLAEYIASFDSTIWARDDASISIREKINYVNASKNGVHGIIRDFPTKYEDEKGRPVTTAFEIKSVLKNGVAEPFFSKWTEIGSRIFIGQKEVVLPYGSYEYTIEYDSSKQILFHKKHEELFLNVNGLYWNLPINHVKATIYLPKTVPLSDLQISGYTGMFGTKEKNFTTSTGTDGSIIFESTKPFAPQEGLTISIAWPKGKITPPTLSSIIYFFIGHHMGWVLVLLSILFTCIFYLFTGLRLRREQKGVIIPLFHPAQELSPSAHHYIEKMGHGAKELSADIVQLAVQGFIHVEATKKGISLFGLNQEHEYSLKRTEKPANDGTPNQQKLLSTLFDGQTVISLTPANRTIIVNATNTLHRWLKNSFHQHFTFHSKNMLIALGVAFIASGIGYFLETEPTFLMVIVGCAPVLMGLFIFRAYTPEGLTLKNEIEGFKLYLETAETERLTIIGTPPTRTPELYETYLPYAIALGVEKQWSSQFTPVFERLAQEHHPYQPVWFGGPFYHHGFDPVAFSSQMSNFSQSLNIPVQTSPTRVSSGMGGGGFSGGGRGGGGGGSW